MWLRLCYIPRSHEQEVHDLSSGTSTTPGNETTIKATTSTRGLRVSVAAILVLLTVQGWSGDFANLFAAYPASAVGASMSDVLQALQRAGVLVLYHALEGILIVAVSVVILILSFRSPSSTWVRVYAILGLGATLSAAAGGLLFVLSAFQNDAYSAQMGGSFIGAYAFYFLVLYSMKKK
jgi:hypothetical protein